MHLTGHQRYRPLADDAGNFIVGELTGKKTLNVSLL